MSERIEKKSVNLRLSTDLIDWYQQMSDKTGIPRATCMTIALMSYKDQQDMLSLTRNLGEAGKVKEQE